VTRRILLILGTRPEAIKLVPLIRDLRARDGMDVRVCVTAQHRDMLDQVLSVAEIVPDVDLDLMCPGQSLDSLGARLLTGIGGVLDSERPERLVVQGDTATAMFGALAAYYRAIPVAHVEAGLRSGDIAQPRPEEVNRRIISSIADLHFAPTEAAAAALLAESVDPATIHITGNTGIDALLWMGERIGMRPMLAAALDPLLEQIGSRRLLLTTVHRRENHGVKLVAILSAIARLAARDDVAVVFPVHPNPAVRGPVERLLGGCVNVHLTGPLEYPSLVRLLSRTFIVLTDSGGLQEEAPALGVPVLVLRETTERPEGIAAGTALLVGAREERIVAAAARLLDDPVAHDAMAWAHTPYGDGRAAARIGDVLGAV
jgi:UDP-N-acetylglucosamine 2-epimerase (non-hydrolysing)